MSQYSSLKPVNPSPMENFDEEYGETRYQGSLSASRSQSSHGTSTPTSSQDLAQQPHTSSKSFLGIRFFSLNYSPDHNNNSSHITRAMVLVLGKVQKYSTYVFSGFFLLHGINVLVAPAIDLGIAEEIMMMARDVYQGAFFEKWMLFGSLIAHVSSGILLRLVRKYQTWQKARSGNNNKKKKNDCHKNQNPKYHPKAKSLNELIQLEREIKYNTKTHDYEIKNESVGLGGWFSIFNIGFRRSVVFRKFGLTPLQFSGYLLVPVLLYHILSERVAPLLVDGDSSLINLGFVAHALNTGSKWVMYPGFAALIYLSLYHVVSGWLKWLKVYSIKKKNAWFLIINGATAVGMYSLWRVSTLGVESGNVGRAFDSYIGYFKKWGF